MSVMSIRIDDGKRNALKVIASLKGETMGGIVSSLIEGYIEENRDNIANLSGSENLNAITALSQKSFDEWDNDEDEVYDSL